MYTVGIVSVIVPCYNEAGNIFPLASEIMETMAKTKYRYEIIFVNDGSTDATWSKICEFAEVSNNFKGVDLAGNYGQTIAIRAGLNASVGDVIVAMDGDMQHSPAYIPQFLSYIEQGYDLVSGNKESQPDGFVKTIMANMAHKAICKLSGVKLKYFGATFKVYRRFLFDNVNLIGDVHRYIGALMVRKGTRYIELPIKIRERNAGTSNYNWSKALLVIVDLISLKFSVSYMNKPFRLFGVPGLIMLAIGSILTGTYTFGAFFLHWNIGKQYQVEFISSVFLILFSLILISLGIIAQIGIYDYFSGSKHEPFSVRDTTSEKINSDQVADKAN